MLLRGLGEGGYGGALMRFSVGGSAGSGTPVWSQLGIDSAGTSKSKPLTAGLPVKSTGAGRGGGSISVSTDFLTHTHMHAQSQCLNFPSWCLGTKLECVCMCVLYVIISLSKWGARGMTAGGRHTHKQGKSLCI